MLLFVPVDTAQGTFQSAWLVPSVDFARGTTVNHQGRRVFAASTRPATRDQWSGYRCSRSELAGRLLDAIDRLV